MRQLASLLLATTSLVAVAAEAPAADIRPRMVTKAPAVAPVAYYNWTGCYVGGHAGWGWGRKDVSAGTGSGPGFPSSFAGSGVDMDGFLGGVQGGCNYQVNPSWVIGIEGQFSWTDMRGDFVIDPFFSSKGSTSRAATFSARTDWVATLAGRFGFTWDRWMLYGKGGVAWAHDKYALVGSTASSFTLNARETRAGWMLGAGVEYAFVNSWSAKLEYNYMNFGSERVTLGGLTGTTPATAAADIDQRMHVIKLGLNYRFGDFGKGPIVARY